MFFIWLVWYIEKAIGVLQEQRNQFYREAVAKLKVGDTVAVEKDWRITGVVTELMDTRVKVSSHLVKNCRASVYNVVGTACTKMSAEQWEAANVAARSAFQVGDTVSFSLHDKTTTGLVTALSTMSFPLTHIVVRSNKDNSYQLPAAFCTLLHYVPPPPPDSTSSSSSSSANDVVEEDAGHFRPEVAPDQVPFVYNS